MSADQVRLIVNADDFGLSAGVNRGIITAHERGIVTSTSLMVRYPAADEAVAYARHRRQLSVGLHFDIGEWEATKDREWRAIYQVVDRYDALAVRRELSKQLERYRKLTGEDPTHLDSHQHVHRAEPAKSELLRVAEKLGVPLRHFDPRVGYCGYFYGHTAEGWSYPEGISSQALQTIFATLKPGITEVGCHPSDDLELPSAYRNERVIEVATLTDPAIRGTLERLQIQLCSFNDI
jgi:chitin disaccharide deacetylase